MRPTSPPDAGQWDAPATRPFTSKRCSRSAQSCFDLGEYRAAIAAKGFTASTECLCRILISITLSASIACLRILVGREKDGRTLWAERLH